MCRLKMVFANCKVYYGGYTSNLFALLLIKERLQAKHRDRLIVIVDEFDKPVTVSFPDTIIEVKKQLTKQITTNEIRKMLGRL